MTRPRIGLTMYGKDEEDCFRIPRLYNICVERAGGIPFAIPSTDVPAQEILEIIDGIILIGGGDICPTHYGGKDHKTLYMIDAQRDTFEFHLFHAAMEGQFPILGICRGIQIMNLALGGTLYAHLPEVVGETVLHRLPPREPVEHAIEICVDSQLAQLLGATHFQAASWHHQALCHVPDMLKVVGHAPDNTIEAIEMTDYPWMIGVQWHPELSAMQDPIQQRLFGQFVEACRSHRSQQYHTA